MYLTLMNRLREALARHIREKYGVEVMVPLERPPKLAMGEAASPVSFDLAKRLKRAPRQIAQEIATEIGLIEGISRVEVAGAGYLNAFFDRGAFWEKSGEVEGSAIPQGLKPASPAGSVAGPKGPTPSATARGDDKIIVEHTSINPNKAAHIGHVRNAVLGDTMARTLRYAGHNVQVQNYIDNTGVQVADVVIGFLDMERRTPVSVKMMAMEERFDYLCWDLYAKVTQFFEDDKERAAKLRGTTLRAIEEGRGEEAEVAQVVADAIVTTHLKTMARLGIGYDLLARESEILHLHFWDTAFEKLKDSGAIQLATGGKMAGCWVMPFREDKQKPDLAGSAEGTASTEADEENSQDKIIVRSNGTVTYVGKDIAYQLWKFGLLGKDFHYARWPKTPNGEVVWATTARKSDPSAPDFGERAAEVYNVIDARQAYPQEVVAEGLRRLGHTAAAHNSIHLSYAFVALTPRCAKEMGYELSAEDAQRPFVDMSGRKGFGVKADDLIDKLEVAALAEVQQRHPEMSPEEQRETGHTIAVGALRFFLLKFTRTAVIAFDFKDALSFEGETGPYCQYAVVRIRGIRRKGAEAAENNASVLMGDAAAGYLTGADGDGFWEVLLKVNSLDYAVNAAITGHEPAFLAKYAFELAQTFNNFYHKHHILSETDAQKRAFLLEMTERVEAQLVRTLDLLGISAPEKM